jgi:hypothetical protein
MIEEEMAATLAKEIQKEIDESILLELLVEGGWTKVPFSFVDIKKLNEIFKWCESNVKKNQYKLLSGSFVFRKKKDAEWFILRWL